MEKTCEVKPKPKTVKEFFGSSYFWKPFLGVFIGALVGFLYYYFVGCSSGSCAITSNPYMSVLWGGLFGLFIVKRPCSSC
jgi:LytS/YehU family sensor histidine kinase